MRSRALVAALLAALFAPAAQAEQAEVFKSATCGCCQLWVKHLEQNGYSVRAQDVAPGVLERLKRQLGIADRHASCHTARIGGYVIEGHVPAGDVKQLLAERPDAVGLTVPGMPIGSPGMEAGGDKEPYQVLLIEKDGSSEVFSRHNQ